MLNYEKKIAKKNKIVTTKGFEPLLSEPESDILSIKLRSLMVCKYREIDEL